MRLLDAIKAADIQRPNEIDLSRKASWLHELEGNVARVMGAAPPENTYPSDKELLAPFPNDNIYELFIASKIDLYHGETEMYANDSSAFHAAYEEFRAAWRREHRLADAGSWRSM